MHRTGASRLLLLHKNIAESYNVAFEKGYGMRRFIVIVFAINLLCAMSSTVFAVLPDEVLSDSLLEARARAISSQLRCLVCQNETIDDSNAKLARDLRLLVRERLVAGDSDAQVIDHIVASYGEYVLLKPRFSIHTALLWLSPFFLLIIAFFAAAYLYLRKKNTLLVPLTAEEEERLIRLLDAEEKNETIKKYSKNNDD